MADEVESSRPSAHEIYERVRTNGQEEITRSSTALGISGLFAGFTVGGSALAYAAAIAYIEGPSEKLIAALVYPIGYIGAIVGRAQLFTENTLYPVVLVFERIGRYLGPTARLWALVLIGNMVGALLIALLVAQTSALPPDVLDELVALGEETIAGDFWPVFWSGVLAGWALALVAWLVEAAETAIGAILAIWLMTLLVALLRLDHSIATTVEAWSAVFSGAEGLGPAAGWWAATLLGNIVGGVFIVTVLNFGQVHSGEPE